MAETAELLKLLTQQMQMQQQQIQLQAERQQQQMEQQARQHEEDKKRQQQQMEQQARQHKEDKERQELQAERQQQQMELQAEQHKEEMEALIRLFKNPASSPSADSRPVATSTLTSAIPPFAAFDQSKRCNLPTAVHFGCAVESSHGHQQLDDG